TAGNRRPHIEPGEPRIDRAARLRQRVLPPQPALHRQARGAEPPAPLEPRTGQRLGRVQRGTGGTQAEAGRALLAEAIALQPDRLGAQVRGQRRAAELEPVARLHAQRRVAVVVVGAYAVVPRPEQDVALQAAVYAAQRHPAEHVVAAVLPGRIELAFDLAVALAVATQRVRALAVALAERGTDHQVRPEPAVMADHP